METENEVYSDDQMEALLKEADLVADADKGTQYGEENEDEKKEMDDAEAVAAESEPGAYEVPLSHPYRWNGREITSIDMSGLKDMTTVDLEFFDRVLERLGRRPVNKYRDTTYAKHVAMRITGLPAEFFNGLSSRDMIAVQGKVYSYFLWG